VIGSLNGRLGRRAKGSLCEQVWDAEFVALANGEVGVAALAQCLAVKLGGAAGQDDGGGRASTADGTGIGEAFLLGPLGDRARMDDAYVADRAEGDNRVAVRREAGRHLRRFGLIQAAAHGFESHPLHQPTTAPAPALRTTAA
jgi:hypothetical protein